MKNKKIITDRNLALKRVGLDGYALQFVSNELKYASDELRNDRDVVLTAVKQDGWALGWASLELRNNKEVVLTAVRQDSRALEWVSKELQNEILSKLKE